MAEIIGTAFVRIRAITAGLASEIKDGFDKGVSDARLDESGDEAGTDFSEGFGKSTEKGMPGALTDSMDKASADVDMPKRGKDEGGKFARGFGDGIDTETRRRNPFSAISSAFSRLTGRVQSAPVGENVGNQFAEGFDRGVGDGLTDALQGAMGDASDDVDWAGHGEDDAHTWSTGYRKGVDREVKRRNPFLPVGNAFDKVLSAITIPGGKFGWATTLGTPAIGGAAKLITSLLGGVVAILGDIGTAAAGAGVALGGMAVTGVPALLAITQALKAPSDELDAFKDHMEDLGTLWQDFGRAAQEGLLPGLEAAADTLTQALLPSLTAYSEQIGDIVGVQAQWAAAALTSADNMEAWQEVLGASTDITETFGRIVVRLADGLPKLFAAVAPVAQRFADDIERLVTRFQDWINTADRERLTDKFQGWYDRFRLLARIAGNFLRGVLDIFEIGAGAGDPFMKRLDRIAERFREFTESRRGRNQIKQFFDNAMPVMKQFLGLVGDLIKLVGDPIFEGDTGGVLRFLKFLRREVVPALSEFADSIKGMGLSQETFENFVKSFIEFTQTMVESGAFTGFLETLHEALDIVSEIVAMPTIGPFVGDILKWVGVLKALEFVTRIPIGKVLAKIAFGMSKFILAFAGVEGLEGAAAALGTALSGLAVPLLILAAAIAEFVAVWVFWDQIIDAIKSAIDWFMGLSTAFKILLAPLLLLLLPIAEMIGLLLGLVGAVKNWNAVAGFFVRSWEAVRDFFVGLPGTILDFIKGIPDALASAADAILDFFTGLPDIITQGLSALGGLAVQVGAAFGNLLLDGLSRIPGFAAQFGSFLLDQLINALSALPGLAVKIGGALLDVFLAATEQLAEWAVELPVQIGVWILEGLGDLADVGVNIIGQILVFLAENLPKLAFFFLTLPIQIANWIVEKINDLIPLGVQLIEAIVRGLIQAGPTIINFFLRLPGVLARAAANVFTFMFNLGVDAATGLFNGIVSLGPKIIGFFQQLPGAILNVFASAANLLFNVGHAIVNGLWQGIQAAWDIVLGFLRELPGRIRDFFADAGKWLLRAGVALIRGLLQGARSFLGAVDDLFGGLPRRIFRALGALAGFLAQRFTAMARAGLRIARNFVEDVVDFFLKLPGRIFRALGSLLGFIRDRFVAAVTAARTRVESWAEAIVGFFTRLPGRIFRALGDLLANIRDRFADAVTKARERVETWATNIVDFFFNLPHRIWNALSNLMSEVRDRFEDMIDTVKTAVSGFIDDVLDFFKDLPGNIVSALAGLGNMVLGAIKTAVNWAIDQVNRLIPPPIHIPGTNIDIAIPDIPHIAMGGIFGEATLAVIGEAGGEAVIPLTRPQRAMQLMTATGLDRLVLRSVQAPPATTVPQEITMVRIETAIFTDPVDLDMLIAKVPHAYNIAVGSGQAGRG